MKFKTPALQVALDFTDLNSALKVAEACVSEGVDILEAGTPLIKSVGVKAVKELKSKFPNTIVSADMKTMDTGGLEVELAANAGADIVSVLGVADDSTIVEARDTARRYGIMLQVDLIGHPKPLERVVELNRLNVDIVCFHVGIDVQRRLGITAAQLLEIVRSVKRTFNGMIAVAGGLKPDNITPMIEAGADIVIVGSAITKSPNPGMACREIKRLLRTKVIQ